MYSVYFESVGNGETSALQHEHAPRELLRQLIPLKNRLIFPFTYNGIHRQYRLLPDSVVLEKGLRSGRISGRDPMRRATVPSVTYLNINHNKHSAGSYTSTDEGRKMICHPGELEKSRVTQRSTMVMKRMLMVPSCQPRGPSCLY